MAPLTPSGARVRVNPLPGFTLPVMQMLPLTAATNFKHRGPQCFLTLTRSTNPTLDQFPLRLCSCPL